MSKRSSISLLPIVLFALFIIAVVLRYWGLPKYLFFGPEQGIDFKVLHDMVASHKFTLIGSKTDVAGIYHGPVFHYLALIPFFLSHGDPLAVSFFMIVINGLSVFLLYGIGKELFSKRVGMLASGLFTFSTGAMMYARWLKEMPLSIPFACLFFYCVARFSKGNKYGLFGAAIAYGLLGQAEFLNFILFAGVGVGVVFLLWKQVRTVRLVDWGIFGFLLGVFSWANFILFDLRHEFLIAKNIWLLVVASHGSTITWVQAFQSFLDTFPRYLQMTLLPGVPVVGVIIAGCVLLYVVYKQTNIQRGLLLLWIVLPFIILFVLRRGLLDQFFVATVPGVILLGAVGVDFLWKKSKTLGISLSVLLFISYLFGWNYYIAHDHNMFFKYTQPTVLYDDELAVVDQIYRKAHGKPFSVQAYTIPYWYQHGWDYLFWYRGFQKYGYLPVPEKAKALYVIVQDDPSGALFQSNWLKDVVSTWGNKTGEFRIGAFRILEIDAHI